MDTTATPDRADGQTPDSDMIYQYDISQALEDKIIKSIVVYEPEVKIVELTYTNPETGEKKIVTDLEKEFKEAEERIKPFQWILDPEPMKKQIALAMLRLQEQKRRAKDRYKPILFVVTMSIQEGKRAQKVLKDVFKINTLLVTEESEEQDRIAARNIGKIDSPYDAVVSVMMLREGWDVPEVSVILLLRKFSSPVYGQQVIGRGLRRIIRDHEEPEILAVIDHPRLDHDWLWRLVAVSKIRQNVLPEEVFGDEDLPEKQKIQRLTKPENFIIIPSPEYETSIDFDKKKTEIPEDQIEERWREKLDSVEYDKNIWLISRTKIESVRASQLDKTRNMEVDYDTESIDQISVRKNGKNEVSLEELREIFKDELLSVASNLLIEAGFGGMKKGILYGAMMDHIKSKIFKEKSLSEADRQDIEFALDNMQEIQKNFSKSVVSGILKGV
jgi:superfamily II DNA or RNA helicase